MNTKSKIYIALIATIIIGISLNIPNPSELKTSLISSKKSNTRTKKQNIHNQVNSFKKNLSSCAKSDSEKYVIITIKNQFSTGKSAELNNSIFTLDNKNKPIEHRLDIDRIKIPLTKDKGSRDLATINTFDIPGLVINRGDGVLEISNSQKAKNKLYGYKKISAEVEFYGVTPTEIINDTYSPFDTFINPRFQNESLDKYSLTKNKLYIETTTKNEKDLIHVYFKDKNSTDDCKSFASGTQKLLDVMNQVIKDENWNNTNRPTCDGAELIFKSDAKSLNIIDRLCKSHPAICSKYEKSITSIKDQIVKSQELMTTNNPSNHIKYLLDKSRKSATTHPKKSLTINKKIWLLENKHCSNQANVNKYIDQISQ